MAQVEASSRASKDAEHLNPSVRPMLDWANEKRIKALKSDDFCFIPYRRQMEIRSKLEECYTSLRTTRPIGVALHGASGNGKTSILKHFMQEHAMDEAEKFRDAQFEVLTAPSGNGKTSLIRDFMRAHPDGETPDVRVAPVVYVEIPRGAGGVNMLLGQILKNFYYRWDLGSIQQKLRRVYNVMSACETRLLIIDEVQRLLAGSIKQRQEILGQITNISSELQIPIVLAGLEETMRVLADDRQVTSRSRHAELPPWEDGPDFRDLVSRFERAIPLAHPSYLYENKKATLILELSKHLDTEHPSRPGILFNIATLIKFGAEGAIRDGSETISEKHLEEAAHPLSWGK